MPANLPPQYVELEIEYRTEKDPKIRLELLQRMLREIPKHKGTDHLVGELKRKISKLKVQLEQPQKHGASRQASLDHVPREGAGQFVLFGPPNSGKSSILGALTRAHVEITEWPYATRKPVAGMALWENVQLQLVDTPSISEEFCEAYVFNIMRTANVAVLVMSLGDDDILSEYEYIIDRVHHGKVRLKGLVPPDPALPTALEVPVTIVATGRDLPDADTRLDLLKAEVQKHALIWPAAIPTGDGLQEFLKGAYSMLGLMRAYTKAPGHQPDLDDPILLPIGSTVGDAARSIHKEIAEQLNFARIWGTSGFDGSRVTADHVIADGDVLEFHV